MVRVVTDLDGGRPIAGEPRDVTSGSEAVIGADGIGNKAFAGQGRDSVFLSQSYVCIKIRGRLTLHEG